MRIAERTEGSCKSGDYEAVANGSENGMQQSLPVRAFAPRTDWREFSATREVKIRAHRPRSLRSRSCGWSGSR